MLHVQHSLITKLLQCFQLQQVIKKIDPHLSNRPSFSKGHWDNMTVYITPADPVLEFLLVPVFCARPLPHSDCHPISDCYTLSNVLD